MTANMRTTAPEQWGGFQPSPFAAVGASDGLTGNEAMENVKSLLGPPVIQMKEGEPGSNQHVSMESITRHYKGENVKLRVDIVGKMLEAQTWHVRAFTLTESNDLSTKVYTKLTVKLQPPQRSSPYVTTARLDYNETSITASVQRFSLGWKMPLQMTWTPKGAKIWNIFAIRVGDSIVLNNIIRVHAAILTSKVHTGVLALQYSAYNSINERACDLVKWFAYLQLHPNGVVDLVQDATDIMKLSDVVPDMLVVSSAVLNHIVYAGDYNFEYYRGGKGKRIWKQGRQLMKKVLTCTLHDEIAYNFSSMGTISHYFMHRLVQMCGFFLVGNDYLDGSSGDRGFETQNTLKHKELCYWNWNGSNIVEERVSILTLLRNAINFKGGRLNGDLYRPLIEKSGYLDTLRGAGMSPTIPEGQDPAVDMFIYFDNGKPALVRFWGQVQSWYMNDEFVQMFADHGHSRLKSKRACDAENVEMLANLIEEAHESSPSTDDETMRSIAAAWRFYGSPFSTSDNIYNAPDSPFGKSTSHAKYIHAFLKNDNTIQKSTQSSKVYAQEIERIVKALTMGTSDRGHSEFHMALHDAKFIMISHNSKYQAALTHEMSDAAGGSSSSSSTTAGQYLKAVASALEIDFDYDTGVDFSMGAADNSINGIHGYGSYDTVDFAATVAFAVLALSRVAFRAVGHSRLPYGFGTAGGALYLSTLNKDVLSEQFGISNEDCTILKNGCKSLDHVFSEMSDWFGDEENIFMSGRVLPNYMTPKTSNARRKVSFMEFLFAKRKEGIVFNRAFYGPVRKLGRSGAVGNLHSFLKWVDETKKSSDVGNDVWNELHPSSFKNDLANISNLGNAPTSDESLAEMGNIAEKLNRLLTRTLVNVFDLFETDGGASNTTVIHLRNGGSRTIAIDTDIADAVNLFIGASYEVKLAVLGNLINMYVFGPRRTVTDITPSMLVKEITALHGGSGIASRVVSNNAPSSNRARALLQLSVAPDFWENVRGTHYMQEFTPGAAFGQLESAPDDHAFTRSRMGGASHTFDSGVGKHSLLAPYGKGLGTTRVEDDYAMHAETIPGGNRMEPTLIQAFAGGSVDFKSRLELFGKGCGSPWRRAMAYLFMGAEVNVPRLERWARLGLPCPVNILVLATNISWETSHAYVLTEGVGELQFKLPTSNLDFSPHHEIIYANFWWFMSTVVTDTAGFMVLPDIFVHKFNGGIGPVFRAISSKKKQALSHHKKTNMFGAKGMIVAAIGPSQNEASFPAYISAAGVYPTNSCMAANYTGNIEENMKFATHPAAAVIEKGFGLGKMFGTQPTWKNDSLSSFLKTNAYNPVAYRMNQLVVSNTGKSKPRMGTFPLDIIRPGAECLLAGESGLVKNLDGSIVRRS